MRITCKTNYAKDQGINVDVVWLVNDGSEPDVDGEKVMNFNLQFARTENKLKMENHKL